MTRFAEASFNLARLLENSAPTAKAVPKSRSGKLQPPLRHGRRIEHGILAEMRKRSSRAQGTTIVAALPHPNHPAMLVTNAVAALANGYGDYDSGEGTVPFTRLRTPSGARAPFRYAGHPGNRTRGTRKFGGNMWGNKKRTNNESIIVFNCLYVLRCSR